jgi:hypothetical protein
MYYYKKKYFKLKPPLFFLLLRNDFTRAKAALLLNFRDHAHTHTHIYIYIYIYISHSVGLLWTRDHPVADTSLLQQAKFAKDRHPCTGGIRTSNPSKLAAADLCLRPRGY